MFALETLKKAAEKAPLFARPDARYLRMAVRRIKPSMFRFRNNNLVPNNPKLSLIIYRNALSLPRSLDPAAMFE